MMSFASLLLLFVTISMLQGGCEATCYFPLDYQGHFVTQSIMSGVPSISYSTLVVDYDQIPVWGKCHRRFGSNFILKEDSGGITCFKCFNMVLRSSNVLQVYTASLDKCYTSEERAISDCPTETSIKSRRSRELMLYRTKGYGGEPAMSPTYCPINGVYSFTYAVNDGTETNLECDHHTSELADCPYGFGFNLKFKGCSFGEMEMSFHCLGDWEGHDGQRYVALMDTQASSQSETRPVYRCALYKEDDETGEVKMALSSDSTCTNHLRTSTDGYETLQMKPRLFKSWPAHLSYKAVKGHKGGSCDLPSWSQGKWEHIHIQDGTLILKDQINFKTYTGRCVGQKYPLHEERFLIYSRNHCGEEKFKCIWLKNRGNNAMEFQIGLFDSTFHNESLCGEENFLDRAWVTQGRVKVTEPTPYPITGEYTGVIPDTEGFCAKLYSDCNNPEIMFYTIFNCFNRSEVYEEREYRCLGQWVEDGQIYTYTERRDMIGYECFVGVLTAKGDIYLKEAGNNCERGQEPLKYGMRLHQISKCYRSNSRPWRAEGKTWTSSSSSSTTNPRNRLKITALPSWKQKELNTNEISYISSSSGLEHLSKATFLACLLVLGTHYLL